jgi:riboflavin synthase alpha subunit
MAFTENLDVFLADFGVSVTAGAVSGLGILDAPGELVAGGMVMTVEYMITAKASDFGTLAHGTAITVDGVAYTVRQVQPISDGRFVEIVLTKT